MGKTFDIKGKSADQGLIKELVPANQAFGKLGLTNYETMSPTGRQMMVKFIYKYRHYNNDILKNEEISGKYTPKNNVGQEYVGFTDKNGIAVKNNSGQMHYEVEAENNLNKIDNK